MLDYLGVAVLPYQTATR